ncbi:hypothetical protein Bbelb_179450 [Branchiostoma belcheri]|nr:hypothetical protein Bbelb_179450 [Branchiostoma belcheri]
MTAQSTTTRWAAISMQILDKNSLLCRPPGGRLPKPGRGYGHPTTSPEKVLASLHQVYSHVTRDEKIAGTTWLIVRSQIGSTTIDQTVAERPEYSYHPTRI